MKTTFKNGLKNGTHVEWNDMGKKVIEGEFIEGVLISKKSLGNGS